MTDKLKACPFCGSSDIDAEGVLASKENGENYSYPACNDCSASCQEWNNRIDKEPRVSAGRYEGSTCYHYVIMYPDGEERTSFNHWPTKEAAIDAGKEKVAFEVRRLNELGCAKTRPTETTGMDDIMVRHAALTALEQSKAVFHIPMCGDKTYYNLSEDGALKIKAALSTPNPQIVDCGGPYCVKCCDHRCEHVKAALRPPVAPCEAVGNEYCWTHDRSGKECTALSLLNNGTGSQQPDKTVDVLKGVRDALQDCLFFLEHSERMDSGFKSTGEQRCAREQLTALNQLIEGEK